MAISGAFDLGALRDSPHVNDKVKLSEENPEVADAATDRQQAAGRRLVDEGV